MTRARTAAGTTVVGSAVTAAGTLGLAALTARRLLVPAPWTGTATVRSATDDEVELVASRDTALPGEYRLVRPGGPSADADAADGRPAVDRHREDRVRIGAVLGSDDGTVRRALPDGRQPALGTWTWDALLHDDLPAPGGTVAETHVLHVHGQSSGPRQVGRGVPVWDALGASSEVVDTTDLPLRSLDPGAADRIVARVGAARTHGARRVVLQGWSAGALACSAAAARVRVDGIVGVSPLLSVRSALRGAVTAARLPAFVGTLATRIATTTGLVWLAGPAVPVRTTEWQHADVPTLLLRSTADPLVAATDVAAAERRGATVVSFRTAPHTLEWNEDPARWEDAVRAFGEHVTAS